MAKNPCTDWTKKRIGKYIGTGKTPLQIAKLKDILIEDIIWCVTRFLPDKLNRKFAFWCAEQCKTKIPEIKNYIKVAKKFYAGMATQEELNAAYEAADSAAYRAAYRAAYEAAYEAAYWAAYEAAYEAADSAAYKEAMQKKQLAKLIEIIKEAR